LAEHWHWQLGVFVSDSLHLRMQWEQKIAGMLMTDEHNFSNVFKIAT
jgi:hypothetical protein